MGMNQSDKLAREIRDALARNASLGETEISRNGAQELPEYLCAVDSFGRLFDERLEEGFLYSDGDSELPDWRRLRNAKRR